MSQNKYLFDENGFLVLDGLFSAASVDRVLASMTEKIAERPKDVVVDNMITGERSTLALTPAVQFETDRFKVNDLHLNLEEVRELALAPEINSILTELLGQTPVLCNSLFFEKGSSQPPHVDSLYMTPRTQGHLIAIWVALEDAHVDAGQLEYFPGSHLIEQMKFSTGSYHAVASEMPAWEAYMHSQVERLGLRSKTFAAKKGDVFVWHAHLLHGGGPIADHKRTRRSLVFHYYSMSDCQRPNVRSSSHGLWLDKPPQDTSSIERLHQSFSELIYLALNPDVSVAIEAGKYDSAWTHYYLHGRHEGRTASFCEEYYLENNVDVAKAVAAGNFSTGFDHYILFGRSEGRTVA